MGYMFLKYRARNTRACLSPISFLSRNLGVPRLCMLFSTRGHFSIKPIAGFRRTATHEGLLWMLRVYQVQYISYTVVRVTVLLEVLSICACVAYTMHAGHDGNREAFCFAVSELDEIYNCTAFLRYRRALCFICVHLC